MPEMILSICLFYSSYQQKIKGPTPDPPILDPTLDPTPDHILKKPDSEVVATSTEAAEYYTMIAGTICVRVIIIPRPSNYKPYVVNVLAALIGFLQLYMYRIWRYRTTYVVTHNISPSDHTSYISVLQLSEEKKRNCGSLPTSQRVLDSIILCMYRHM